MLATKAFLPMGEGRNHRGSSRRWLVAELEASLRRLDVDHVDLYQVHRWDPTTSDEETLSALTDLQRAGKIRYFGSSTFPAYRIVAAQWAAREHHLGRYVTEQPGYSILQRDIESHVLPATQEHGMGVLVWSPLASGCSPVPFERTGTSPPVARPSCRRASTRPCPRTRPRWPRSSSWPWWPSRRG